MTSGDLHRAWALVEREVPLAADRPSAAGRLQRLCRAAAGALPATGVGVSLLSGVGDRVSAFGSSAITEQIEELQFVMGEGPCLAAFDSGRPVLIPDLAAAGRTRWPGYAHAVQEHGIEAVFAFPLQVGAVRFGALDVYQAASGRLFEVAMRSAMDFAEIAMQTLLDAHYEAEHEGAPPVAEVLGGRPDVYQAQGMLMIQLGVPSHEALSRLRAYAFAHERRVEDVAADVVARRLTFTRDER